MKSEISLILGGARSGKSSYAQELAHAHELAHAGASVWFVATAEALDDEMRARIAAHRAERPRAWRTLEAPRDLPRALAQADAPPQLALVDCLTLWVTNEMLADENALAERLRAQLDWLLAWAQQQGVALILVSNEVGLGIVPENALARRFRDALGLVNAYVAQRADTVYWMVAGLPLEIKSIARARRRAEDWKR